MISKKSTLALVLGMIIMASSLASASYLNDFGGARTTSAESGSTAGAVSKIQLANDPGTDPANDDPAFKYIDGIAYGNVLRQWIKASATVPNGVTGTASASVDTEGAKAFRSRLVGQPVDNNFAYISTSLDGIVEASVTKTSQQGSALAVARMQSEAGASITKWGYLSGIGDKALGGSAIIEATVAHTGIGSALANAEGDALFDGALSSKKDDLGLGLFEFGEAYTTGWTKGNVKLSGSNVKYGGVISGLAAIRSGTSLADRVGRSITVEELCLNAKRDISFEGDSTIEGIVDGLESGETKIGDTTVDVETSSVMNGKARALNRHDSAAVFLLVNSRTGTNGKNAISDNIAYGSATTTRDSIGSADEKAEAEGYITDATWTASTALKADVPDKYRYASVQGKLGGTPDGLPEDLPGLGVGSWIMNPYINPMRSQAWSYELAATDLVTAGTVPQTLSTSFADPNLPGELQNTLGSRVNSAEYQMVLEGMKVTDETNDAVGAYLGLDTQIVTNTVDGYKVNGELQPRRETRTLTIAPMNGIQWIEGNNPSLLPGTYTPPIVPFGLGQTAVKRTSGLRDFQKQV